jgi:hypothetical protein
MPATCQFPQSDSKSPDTNMATNRNQKIPLKFWEIDHFFKCPVVGMCLTLSEQKQLLKKAGITVKDKSPFEIHEVLVASAESESRLSRRVDNRLNRKFGKEAELLLGLDTDEFRGRFKSAFEAGDCIAVSWAAAINPGLPTETKREIFGDIHMAMHWSGEQSNMLKQKVASQRKEMDELRESSKKTIQLGRTLQKENEHLRQDLAGLKITLSAVEKERSKLADDLAALKSRHHFAEIEQENHILKIKLEALLATSEEKERQMLSMQERNVRLSSEIERQQESNWLIKNEAQEIIEEIFTLNRCDANCPSFDLCKKRILLVGGITRMESLYRDLIERSGGIFEYHDGYMKKGVKKLEGRLRRADVVVCPVNCNSHAACSIVKNLAKKHNKTLHMLANSSLSAVSQALRGTSDGGTIN